MSVVLRLLLVSVLVVISAAGRPKSTKPALTPKVSPRAQSAMGPIYAPALAPSPHFHRSFSSPPSSRHKTLPPLKSPAPGTPPKIQGCDEVFCSDPLTSTPIGSPCGCVYPMKVEIDVGVAPYQLFSRIADLEVDVAAGTFLRQSQVRIMGATASTRNPEKTTVTIDLVPLGERFDKMTAYLTYERFWQKKVSINMSLFGDYDVLYVHYPGLPSFSVTPPTTLPTGTGSHQYPLVAEIPVEKKQKMSGKMIALISLSSFILVLILTGLVYVLLRLKKNERCHTTIGSTLASSVTRKAGNRSIFSSSLATSISMSFVSTKATCRSSVKTFSLAELEKATDNFSAAKILGEGGFGRVYHGVMSDESEVAVKLLTREDQNGDREFIAEVEMLSRLHHRNLVKLIGVCIEGKTRCLIYELVRNGSLESHLHGVDRDKGLLDWDTRIKIALGAARALAYLHEDSNPHVIHRDFKSSNVLLEDDFTPKVSDFGLAREASEGIEQQLSTQIMGTFGYVAPEYAMTGHLLVKSDVYSYGVVLLELLSGRTPICMSQHQGPENLVTWARPLLTSTEGLEQLVDPSLRGKYDFENMAKVAAIASMCVHTEASQRPFMGEVVQALKLICNDRDVTCDNSFSQMEESLGADSDFKGDFDTESCWWNGSTPRLTYSYASPFVTMEYSSGSIEEMQRPHSVSTLVGGLERLVGLNRSGPLRTKKNKRILRRLRGSMSEHGHPSRRLGMEGA